ncbi:MAG: SMC domain protein [Petrotoga mobilis]|nr:MAG: SMC domain protein [Petrotoga mobilis]
MAIKRIRVRNFKSFKDLEVELGKFNVLIGANASGKSNFIRIFEFLRDIVKHGLDNAISMQGGSEYLRNISIGSSEDFSLEVVSDRKFTRRIRTREKELLAMKTYETIYKFTINFNKTGSEFKILEDKITQKCKFVRLEGKKEELQEKEELGEGEILFSNVEGELKVDIKLPAELPITKDDIFPRILREEKIPPKTLLIELPLFPFIFPPLEGIFGDVSIYDFDPKLFKKAVPITGKMELEENGENLAIVLKNILEDKEKERKLSNLVRDLLPFVNKLDIEKFADKSLLFKLEEIYAQKQYLPSPLISDGTINITALVIALYFEKKLLTIIEEPERNIHPSLISGVVQMLKEASQKKQIIVTTHNPEMVRHTDLESILLISRDKEGFSNISRPFEKEEVKTFLKNDIGIEELYVQDLLEA